MRTSQFQPRKTLNHSTAGFVAAAAARPWAGRGRGRRHIFERMARGRALFMGAGWTTGSAQKPPNRGKAPPPAPPPLSDHRPAMRWCCLIEKVIKNHRAAYRALAEMWSKNMPKRLDTRRPCYGFTIQGQRWGWREIRSFW